MGSYTYSDQELLSDLFGFLPNHLTDKFYDIMNACLLNIINGISEKLISSCPEKEYEITEALLSFERQVEMELDAAFNTFQDYVLGSVLAVPRHLDIKYDDITDIPTDLTQKHEDILDEHLDGLRKKIIAQKRLNHFLKKKVNSMENELSSLDEYSENLTFLSEIQEKHDVIDIEFSTENVKNSLENLNKAITQALPILQNNFENIKPEERTLEIRSNIQAQLKLIKERQQ